MCWFYWKLLCGCVWSVVESVGEHVEEVKEGDLVVPVFLPSCKECRDCTSTKSNLCTKFGSKFYQGMPRDGSSRFRNMKGEVVHHFLFVSSFVEYTVVDIAHVVRLNHEIPADKACLLSCGVSTGERIHPPSCISYSLFIVIKFVHPWKKTGMNFHASIIWIKSHGERKFFSKDVQLCCASGTGFRLHHHLDVDLVGVDHCPNLLRLYPFCGVKLCYGGDRWESYDVPRDAIRLISYRFGNHNHKRL